MIDLDGSGKHRMSLQGLSDGTNPHIISDERDVVLTRSCRLKASFLGFECRISGISIVS